MLINILFIVRCNLIEEHHCNHIALLRDLTTMLYKQSYTQSRNYELIFFERVNIGHRDIISQTLMINTIIRNFSHMRRLRFTR